MGRLILRGKDTLFYSFLGDCLKLEEVSVAVCQISWIFWSCWMPIKLGFFFFFSFHFKKSSSNPVCFYGKVFYFCWVYQVHVVLCQEKEEPNTALQCWEMVVWQSFLSKQLWTVLKGQVAVLHTCELVWVDRRWEEEELTAGIGVPCISRTSVRVMSSCRKEETVLSGSF